MVLKNQTVTTAADQYARTALEKNPRFAEQFPTTAQIEHCRSNCEKYESLQSSIHAAEQEGVRQPKKTNIFTIVLLLLGIAAAAAGGWMIFVQQFLYGIIAVGAGALVMLIALIILLLRRKAAQKDSKYELLAQMYRDSDRCSAEIREFLSPYCGTVEPKRFLPVLTQLQHDLEDYTQAQQQLRDWENRKAKHTAELESCRQELAAFFDRYKIEMSDNIRDQLYQLREDIHEARTLLAKKRELAAQLEEFRQQYAVFLDVQPATQENTETLKSKETAARAAINALNTKLLRQKQAQQLLRAQTDCIPSLREELAHWQRKLSEDRKNAAILDATMEFLQQSKENLSTAYLGTIQSRFGYYLSQLEGISGEKYLIDTDFQVQLERFGKTRELAYFSAGQTDLIMLCMRLALVDALFKEQEVFVILDDPFVNLDDVHTVLARKLLHKLAPNRQILYLTCHSSRTI